MGQTHLRALRASSDAAVVAVAEPVVALRDSVVTNFGLTGYASLEDLLDAGGIDGVLIVTPSDSHVEVVRRVAQAKLPILCEKPCGINAADTKMAQRYVADAGVPLQVAYWRRFVPELQAIRAHIGEGKFGDVLASRVCSGTASHRRPRFVPAAAGFSLTWACTSSIKPGG
jgi:myo-inositol 2-dehydrogenase/D-chiro-inositol 1-dehydrogenase